MLRIVLLSLPFLLAACSVAPTSDTGGNAVDPAITAALADPLMADPQLDRRANRDMLRPDDDPYRAMIPPGSPSIARRTGAVTLAARMEPALRAARGAFARCDHMVRYSYGWAADLPKELVLPPEAQVAEAAGNESAGCRLRLVAYAAALAPQAMLGRYRDVAHSSGYAMRETRQDGATTMTAQRRDGAAFIVRIEPGDGGSVVDLFTNRGR